MLLKCKIHSIGCHKSSFYRVAKTGLFVLLTDPVFILYTQAGGQRSGHPYSGWLYTLIMWAHNLSLNSNIAGHILFCPSYVIKKQLSINIIMKIIMPLTIIYMIPSNAYTHDKFVSCTPVITGSFHTTLFSSTCLSTYPSINIILFYFYMCPLILQSPPS